MKWSDLELIEKLGEGKAGVVWRANNTDARTRERHPVVAVKRYKHSLMETPGQMERIVRELRAGREIHHPHLVQTIELVFDDQQLPALVMQHYGGQTLDKYLRECNYVVAIDQIITIAHGLAAALKALHDGGVIHRDVKPANIQIVENQPVLMDLGVVRLDGSPSETTTDQFLGTIRYSDPAVLFGRHAADPACDIYSLGLVLREMVFQQEHCSSVSNWAELVLQKEDELGNHWPVESTIMPLTYNAMAHSPSWMKHWSKRLSHANSLLIADLFAHVLSMLLERRPNRPADVSAVMELLNCESLDEPFHIVNGRIEQGEASVPPSITNVFPEQTTLAAVWDSVLRQLPEDLLSRIAAAIRDTYPFTLYCAKVPVTASEMSALHDCLSSITFELTEAETNSCTIAVHPVLFDLYRHGYLRPST